MSIKVLVVDDEADVRDYLAKILSREDFNTLVVSSGEECLRVATQEKPDIILLDIIMPVMDGFQVLSSLRSNETTQDIPVVMLTAKRESQSIFESTRLGCNDYVMKPFEKDSLLKVINRHVKNVAY